MSLVLPDTLLTVDQLLLVLMVMWLVYSWLASGLCRLTRVPILDVPLFAPKGPKHVSPGQRPGLPVPCYSQALKGRNKLDDNLCPAPSGLTTFSMIINTQGGGTLASARVALPWAIMFMAFGQSLPPCSCVRLRRQWRNRLAFCKNDGENGGVRIGPAFS